MGRLALRLLVALVVVASAGAGAADTPPVDAVDPFIGTGGHGHTFPGATMPFGLVQLSPDTRLTGWDGCSGYHHTDDVVYGFSHTHLSGTGVSDYGDVLFMPASPTEGDVPLDNGAESGPDTGYASRFRKVNEDAEPGYYATHLSDEGIDVELTVTERTGLHRYRFLEGRAMQVVLDLAHRDPVIASSLRIVDEYEIEGMRRSSAWAEDQHVYFVARFSRPILRTELERDGVVFPGMRSMSGTDVRARFTFAERAGGDPAVTPRVLRPEELVVRVGISAVDIDGARRNLDAEQGDREFDDVRRAAREAWSRALGKIDVAGASEAEREIFYTSLYHTMIAPNVWSDVDGRYRGMDGKIHLAEGRRQYTVFSLWDTFRAAHPLYTLIEQQRTREFLATFLAQYEQGGRLPVWELAANETDCMIGYHSVPVIADAWIKGLMEPDTSDSTCASCDEALVQQQGDALLDAMLDSATRDHFGLEAYRRQGFIGIEDEAESVSKTLEYAFDDWCIARLAERFGYDDLVAEYDRRSGAWRHLFDPQTGFMRARRNQRWLEPFDPRRVDNHYTEANAWQYRFFVPHDNAGLIEALGGDEAFVAQLDAMFEADSATTGRDQADITGLIGQYAHGNEPSHHVAWLYHYAGRPDRSAERVHRILAEMYTPEPDGLSGNEDCGQMSAWYVFSAMGFYPATPCTVDYPLGPPLFERVTLNLENGRVFTIRRRGAAPQQGGLYVASATLDGEPFTRSYLRHDEIVAGGELVLTLTRERPAGDGWGRSAQARPRTEVAGEPVPPAPYVVSASDRFRDRLTVELRSADPDATILYTTDDQWSEYTGPLALDESTRLTFYSRHGDRESPRVQSYLHRIPNEWTVTLADPPLSQYTAGGPEALVDGLPGDANWRTGGWLGFQGVDLSATIDLGEARPVRTITASFLQDQRSWIWMPREVVFLASNDGESFFEIGRGATDVPEDADGTVRRTVGAEFGEAVRYIRVDAVNYGTIPDWHLGHGGQGFIFVDEITVD